MRGVILTVPGRICRCVDKAINGLGISRIPDIHPPVAYSRLPTNLFTKGTDTGLSFQVGTEDLPSPVVRGRGMPSGLPAFLPAYVARRFWLRMQGGVSVEGLGEASERQ